MILNHVPDSQVLEGDEVVLVNEHPGKLGKYLMVFISCLGSPMSESETALPGNVKSGIKADELRVEVSQAKYDEYLQLLRNYNDSAPSKI